MNGKISKHLKHVAKILSVPKKEVTRLYHANKLQQRMDEWRKGSQCTPIDLPNDLQHCGVNVVTENK